MGTNAFTQDMIANDFPRFRPLASPFFIRNFTSNVTQISTFKAIFSSSHHNWDLTALQAAADLEFGAGLHTLNVVGTSFDFEVTFNEVGSQTVDFKFAGVGNNSNLINYPNISCDSGCGNEELFIDIDDNGTFFAAEPHPPWGGGLKFNWVDLASTLIPAGIGIHSFGASPEVGMYLARDAWLNGDTHFSTAFPYQGMPGRLFLASIRHLTKLHPRLNLNYGLAPVIDTIDGHPITGSDIAFGPLAGGNIITVVGKNFTLDGNAPRMDFFLSRKFILGPVTTVTAEPGFSSTVCQFIVPSSTLAPGGFGPQTIDMAFAKTESGDSGGIYVTDMLQSYSYVRDRVNTINIETRDRTKIELKESTWFETLDNLTIDLLPNLELSSKE